MKSNKNFLHFLLQFHKTNKVKNVNILNNVLIVDMLRRVFESYLHRHLKIKAFFFPNDSQIKF